jgi:signal peptidase II
MPPCDSIPTRRERLIHLVIPVLVIGILADQASKSWASNHAAEPRMLVPGYLAAYSVENSGCFLGLGGSQAGMNAIIMLTSTAVLGLLMWIAHVDRRWWRGPDCLAVALLFAGALGNTLDRVALGHVRDFLVTWIVPRLAFNVADLFAVAGFILVCLARGCDHWYGRGAARFARRAAA